MGKRTLVRRRGKGGKQFRAIKVGKLAPAKYPYYNLDENHSGVIVDLVHETGRDAPLAKVRFENGINSYIPASDGLKVGDNIEMGQGASATARNILPLGSIPDGTIICNIEKNVGDGGKLIKSAGSSAIVFSHGMEGVTIKFPSGKFSMLNRRCRAYDRGNLGRGKERETISESRQQRKVYALTWKALS